jgi:myosin heavy subunit
MIVTIHHLFIIYPSSIHQVNKQLFNKSLTPEQSRYSRDALARVIYKTLFNWIVNEVGR